MATAADSRKPGSELDEAASASGVTIDVPEAPRTVIDLLEGAGFEAFVVGGCVRDSLMGRQPHDWDVTTSALPQDTKHVLEAAGIHTFDTGIAHGTITALVEGDPIEVTTYRTDGPYLDGRHPSTVAFVPTIDGDLARRDLTVNAMAYSPTRGLVDLYGGREDLARHVLRCVGDPAVRFGEDGLRIMRVLRFAATLGFSVDPETAAAIHAGVSLLDRVSAERIRDELLKLLAGERCVPVLREYVDVVTHVIPELAPEVGFNQHNPYHRYDVWEHTLHALAAAPADMDADVRLAVLLHDVGKPQTFEVGDDGIGHMYGHAEVGAGIASEVCRRLRLPGDDRRRVVSLVRWHMYNIPETPKAVRRFLLKHGRQGTLDLIAVRRCDRAGIGTQEGPIAERLSEAFETFVRLVDEQLAAEPVFGVRDLAVGGRDLMAIGFEQGPALGKALSGLLDAVVDGEVPNEREALLARARELLRDETE